MAPELPEQVQLDLLRCGHTYRIGLRFDCAEPDLDASVFQGLLELDVQHFKIEPCPHALPERADAAGRIIGGACDATETGRVAFSTLYEMTSLSPRRSGVSWR